MACASTPVAPEAAGENPISTVGMTCSKPYRLTRDCSLMWGASREVFVEGYRIKVAGSEAGDVILVMEPDVLENALSGTPFVLNSPVHSQSTNNSFYALRCFLDAEKIEVTRVRAVTSFGNIDGDVLELNGDGYSLLEEHTRE